MVMDLRFYDVIGFGDEVPGVLAVISAAREYRRRTKRYPRVLLMSKGNLQEGIGGHLVRGGLAYLDRSQIGKELRQSLNLDTFGSPATIYQEFLQKSGVSAIALDPRKASAALKEMLLQAGVDILSQVEIQSVNKQRQKIASITTSRGIVYAGKQFIDATVNAELAQAAGASKLNGFETFGLSNSELPVTLIFETQGLSARRLKELDYIYLKRFTNLADSESQKFLLYAAGKDVKLAEELRQEMSDTKGNLKTLWAGNDYIDVRSPALSVAYHSFRGRKLSFPETGIILDEGNIAILPDSRLSWNALLFAVTGSEAEALARSGSKPTANMQKEMLFVATWLRSLGATSVNYASELYIRHAGNVTGVVEPLTGAQMLLGGVPANQALATFSYHFDVRGGIAGMGEKANSLGWFNSLSFKQPTFNIGIRHALMKNIPNLAVVSPCSGFEGFACSVGRIVEFNAAVGQGVGIAAINAILNNKTLADVSNGEVRQVLVETGQLPRIFGVANNADGMLLAQFETLVGADAIA
ncbi:FAD-dependent oxidoreductase [Microcoleus sp. LEGE 07076]|uniref:FAD-dependent oxidoreductase n=1 Tax=Microcoleus sp. LEGE 07076 TaxID=915322 RepID=UPI001882937F|nr:FAD-dependent oxidoreductase [Microcoleus sp. LEGE 07076]MBE9184112.1 FAD-dependent oxidoreductase [Microcoleus sp. LEGE 07076]